MKLKRKEFSIARLKRFRDWSILLKMMTIPVFIMICVFLLVIFYFLPLVEKKLKNEKKIATKHVVEVVFKQISYYYSKSESGEISEDEAQKKAITIARNSGYGDNGYFWIINENCVTLMNPDRRLEGENTSDLKDENGKYFIREFVKKARENNQGYVDYMWLKKGSDKPVPKISYIKFFKPWGWILGSGVYIDDVENEMKTMRFQVLFFTVIVCSAVLILSYLLSRMINNPLREALEVLNQIISGDLTVTINSGTRSDEMGILMNAFHNILEKLRNQTRKMMECTNTMTSFINQISSTATQLAGGAFVTLHSVSEVTTTVEELKQISTISMEKARNVAESAERATNIVTTGKSIIDEAISGMNRIKEDMEYVFKSIMKLSEHTQSIEEIITTVKDLADQSNILSVNASIEAAKAGEHGIGFAVVAQEVKSLADQSKQATVQIRTILSDIQKATGDSVTAVEHGYSAVEAGVELIGRSGDSIDILSSRVTESSHAAVQIAVSSQQQVAGIDQVVNKVQNIKDISVQNEECSQRLEHAAKEIEEMGQELKHLASMFYV
ncbi:MAG: methyl-accepting chemotaxis protein [Desulfobacterales bacterium]|nr:methyl-accepting chemotaxis protein [Desulfobacterales bacterium]